MLICIGCVCVCPARSQKLDAISLWTFRQHEELLLENCTNCLKSYMYLLKHKVVNTPFAFLLGFNIKCSISYPPFPPRAIAIYSKPHPPCAAISMVSQTIECTCTSAFALTAFDFRGDSVGHLYMYVYHCLHN